MVERVFRRGIWRAEIVITICHENFEMRVIGHRRAQRLANVEILILGIGIRPRMNKFAQGFIRQVGLELEFRANVIIKRSSIRANGIRQQRIIFGMIGDVELVKTDEAAVEATDGLSALA